MKHLKVVWRRWQKGRWLRVCMSMIYPQGESGKLILKSMKIIVLSERKSAAFFAHNVCLFL